MAENDSVQSYQDAIAKLNEVERRAAVMASFIVDAGQKLQDWKDVSFSNLSISYPIGRRYSIIGDRWPTGLEIAKAINDYHSAQHEAENAYSCIPAERRTVIKAPPNAR